MDLGLEGRVAAVAAASEGLGRAAAAALAREGASVAICSRDAERIRKAAAAVQSAAREAGRAAVEVLPVAADLSTPDGPERFVRAAIERFGRLDILVANNGGPPPGRAAEIGEDAWRAGIDGTLLGSIRLARAAIPEMRRRRWGRIIFITSVSVKQPIENLAVSTALRSGVVGFAKSLADDLAAEGITVNSVAPGSMATARLEDLIAHRARDRGVPVAEARAALEAQIPARRIGRPEELAAAIAFLAGEPAAFITGVVLPVDGGQTRSIT